MNLNQNTNMDILEHFESSKEEKFIIFSLKDDEWDDFSEKLPKEFRKCFVSDRKLKTLSKKLGKTTEEIISDRIPTTNKTVQSGDFGEILAYFLFKEKYRSININGIKRWKWKDRPERSEQGVDVMLWSVDINKPSPDDLLLSAESKMMATKGGSQIQSSIEGAISDFGHTPQKEKNTKEIKGWKESKISRIAENLTWLKIKTENDLEKDNTKEEELKIEINLKILQRFLNAKSQTYKKEIKAITFIDKDYIKEEKKKENVIPEIEGLNLEIYIVGIKDLKKMYEKIYSEIPRT